MINLLGVIYFYDGSNTLHISNCNFSNSTATEFGGMINLLGVLDFYYGSNILLISNCNFSNSTAIRAGGIKLLTLD